jgi:adenosylhomocysteine nucleosidase
MREQAYGFVCAMSAEASAISRHLAELREVFSKREACCWASRQAGETIVLLQTGMGPARAARGVEILLERYSLKGLFSLGFAGAVDPHLKTGDVVIASRVVSLDNLAEKESYQTDRALMRRAVAALNRLAQGYCVGKIATVDQFVPEAARKRTIFEATGARAIDMESAAVAAVASNARVPVAAVRAISDAADLDLSAWYRHVISLGTMSAVLAPVCDEAINDLSETFKQNSLVASRNLSVLAEGLVTGIGSDAAAGKGVHV